MSKHDALARDALASSTTERLEAALSESRTLRETLQEWPTRLRASVEAYHADVRAFNVPFDGVAPPPRNRRRTDPKG